MIDKDGQDHKGSTIKSNTQFERYKDADEELKVDDDDFDEEAKKPVKVKRAYNSSKKKNLSDYEPSYESSSGPNQLSQRVDSSFSSSKRVSKQPKEQQSPYNVTQNDSIKTG